MCFLMTRPEGSTSIAMYMYRRSGLECMGVWYVWGSGMYGALVYTGSVPLCGNLLTVPAIHV